MAKSRDVGGNFWPLHLRASVFGDKAYLCGRRNRDFEIAARGEGAAVESAMLESDDGLVWKTRGLFQEDHGDETAFFFEQDGSVFAIGRGSGGPAQIIRSPPPYEQWTRRNLDRNVGGPLVTKWHDRIVVAGRKYAKSGAKTSFYWLDVEALSTEDLLTEFAELPSGGDNSYPGFVQISPTKAIVSWYSSHEQDGRGNAMTAIYMADLQIKPAHGKSNQRGSDCLHCRHVSNPNRSAGLGRVGLLTLAEIAIDPASMQSIGSVWV